MMMTAPLFRELYAVLMLSALCVFSHIILTTKMRSQCREYPHFVYTGRT